MGEEKVILLVANTSWSFWKFRKGLIVRLLQEGFRIYVLAPVDETTGNLIALGIDFIPLRYLKKRGLNPFNDLSFVWELYKQYRRIKPDLIVQYTIKPNIYGSLAAFSLGLPSIAVVTGLGYTFINKGIVPELAKLLYRFSFQTVRHVWFLNEEDKSLFLQMNLVRLCQVSVINGEGINCTTEFNATRVPLPVRNDDKIRFILVGRLLYDKGIREYVEAARIIKLTNENVEFNLLGYLNVENPSAVRGEELDAWISEGLVTYLGSAEDIRPIILSHDCVVLPSYREGMSTILQESAALGKPLIATDIAGCRELIEDGLNGFLCRVRDGNDLARVIQRFLLLDKSTRMEMGQRGRERVFNLFDESIIIKFYLEKIEEIIS